MAERKKVADVIKEFFEEKGIGHVFLLSGGMMMHLLDSISRSNKISYVCNHHEQACAVAAEAYGRVKNDVGLCYATSGPGATNTITGIAGAWLDSSPVIFLTGQSRTTLTVQGAGIENLRMLGNFEVNIVEIAKPITKYAVFVDKPESILYHLEKAYYLAKSGRPGPVLLDIPLDVQGAMVDASMLEHFTPPEKPFYAVESEFKKLAALLMQSKKPVLIAGHGIRVAGEVERFRNLVHCIGVPVVTTQLANDLLPYDDDVYIGKVGLRGDRAGNFSVQGADLIISIGSSLHITTTGYELEHFAPDAKKVIIDIDKAVLKKNASISQLRICCDVSTAMTHLEADDYFSPASYLTWLKQTRKWKALFPIIAEPHPVDGDQINTYHFLNALSDYLKGEEILITDAGSLYYITGQALKSKASQRIIISGALGAMGYALPASIGACFASPGKNVICLTGDGSMQMNVQELQTVAHYNLNCKIIVINNKGYASIRNSQASFQGGNIAASSEATGVTFPNWEKLASAYSIRYTREDKFSNLSALFDNVFMEQGPVFVELVIPETVVMIPAVTSIRLPNGSFKSNQLHQMSPDLPSEKLEEAGLLKIPTV